MGSLSCLGQNSVVVSKGQQTLLAPLLRAGYLKHRVTETFSISSRHPHSKGHTETHIES